MASVSKSQPEPAIMLRSQGCRSSGFSQSLILLFHCNNISNVRAKTRGARHPGSSFVSQLTSYMFMLLSKYNTSTANPEAIPVYQQVGCQGRAEVYKLTLNQHIQPKSGSNPVLLHWGQEAGERGGNAYTKKSSSQTDMIYYPLSNVSIILLLSLQYIFLNLILHAELMASLLTPSIWTFNSKLYVLYPRFLSQMTSTNHTQEIWTHECQVTNCTKQENRKRGISYLWLW